MKKKMKTIGIPTARYESVFGMNAKYVDLASRFGKPKLLVPHEENRGIDSEVDMLLLPGGADPYDTVEGGMNYLQSRSNPHLDWFDINCLPEYINRNIPIFAICRGMQALNIHLGGTLINVLGHQYNDNETQKCKSVHKVSIKNSDYLDKQLIQEVNSVHHLAVGEIGTGLRTTSIDPSDGTIEVLEHVQKPIVGVQWHPEKIHDEFTYRAIEKLLNYTK